MIAYRPRIRTRRVILQHTMTDPGRPDLANHLTIQDRVAGLLTTGSHLLILHDGHPVETRPFTVQGAHCRGHDRDSIGVRLEGTGALSAPQLETLRYFVDRWKRAYGDRLDVSHKGELRGHMGRVPLPIDMDQLRKDLEIAP